MYDNRISLDQLAVAADQKNSEENYWLNRFSGEFIRSNFPYDFKEGDLVESQSDSITFQLEGKSFSRLMELTNNSDVRLFIVLVSVVTVLLYKYSGDKDITLGAPIYKQEMEAEFINTALALRNRVQDNRTFKELLLQVGQVLFEAVENQNYPIETLLYHLNIPFSQETNFPLFDITILLENIHDKKYIQRIRTNMTFSFLRTEQQLRGMVEYNSLRYEKRTIQQIVSHFINLLVEILHDIDTKISDICILSREEKKQFLFDYNNTRSVLPEKVNGSPMIGLHELFEQQVVSTPDHIAVAGSGIDVHRSEPLPGLQLTYGELNQAANRLARVMREKGVKANTPVGLMLENSLETVVGMLAILKAGGAYLPIDVNLPAKRMAVVLEDSQIPIILTKSTDIKPGFSKFLQYFQGPQQELSVTVVRPPITNLDNLPFPDRSLVNYEKYNHYIGQAMVKNSIALQATRGCPYNCAFCHKIWPKQHLVRSAENIFAEVKLYYDMGVRRFVFIDDIFNLHIQNSTRFFQLVVKNGLDAQLFFPNGIRGDILTREYIDLMVEAGTVNLAFALETGSPRLQKLIQKNMQLEKLEENIDYFCKKHPHVILELFSIIGFPTETQEEALMTLNFIKKLKWIHFPYFNFLKVFENTDMEQLALRSGVSQEAIARAQDLAYHELPDTLPFDKGFAKKCQAEFLNDYFLCKERLLHVLPFQMKILNQDEIIQKYNSYFPDEINNFAELLQLVGIYREELAVQEFLPPNSMEVRDLNKKIKQKFPARQSAKDAYRILLLDLSQFFSHENPIVYDVVEPPLGLMYIMTDLEHQFPGKINGKIAKSRIDFDNYHQLKALIKEFRPDLIGIRTLNYYKDFFHKTIALIRQWDIDVPIIAGGPYATSGYERLLQDKNVALAVLGEGEETISVLVGKILENAGKFPREEQLKEINGIAYAVGRDQWQKYSSRQIIFLDAITDGLSRKPGNNLKHISSPRDLAYIIYTSGSTGQPKGTMIQHQGLLNYICWSAQNYVKNQEMDFPLFTSSAFDLTVTSIFTPLVTGNTLVIYNGDQREFLIRSVLEENRVDIVKLTPSHLKLIRNIMIAGLGSTIFHQENTLRIKCLIVGGENLETQLANDIHRLFKGRIRIFNEYGPTETVVGSMIYQWDPQNQGHESVPIGVPIDNTQIYLLDSNKKPVPIGVVGDIYISGLGVGLGYLNQVELTADKFVNNPFLPGEPMYATGDLARRYPDRNIEFLGRRDEQVKIRGFRVELGEIENKIRKFSENHRPKSILAEKNVKSQELKEVTRCQECLLPANYPGIRFNDRGVCHVCNEFEQYREHVNRYFKKPGDFIQLLETLKTQGSGNSKYHCLLLFSGGKDSSYVLYRLMEMGLNVLTLTFDNGYISEAAFKNIQRITSLLKVDNIVVKTEHMKRIFVESLLSYHNVCQGCWHALNTIAAQVAQEQGINLVISGLSRGQIFDMRLEGLYQVGIFDENEIEEKLLLFRKAFHSKNNRFSRILNMELDEKAIEKIQFVDFFRYFAISIHEIKCYLSAKEWQQPGDTGFCSSNCVINDVGIYMHLKEEGYHFYAAPLSWDIRLGQLTREAGLAEMVLECNPEEVDRILEEIGYYNTSFIKNVVVVDRNDENGNPMLYAYITAGTEISLFESALREYLSQELPDYMVPSYFVQVDEIPLTPSGKVDKKALLNSGGTTLKRNVNYVEPGDEKEKLMAHLCKEVFRLDKIGIYDNFFSLGATSFGIIQLNSRLQEAFKREIPVLTMFEYPTIASFLEHLHPGIPVSEDSREEEAGRVSRKQGQEKFKKLRNRRINLGENENE